MKCPVCNTNELTGKQRVCSGACRVRLSRQKGKPQDMERLEQEVAQEAAGMSQAEIEEHYTKENYPSLKYGPAGSPNPPHMRSLR